MSWKRFVFATDIHGDRQHKPTVDALLRFCDLWKPQVRVCGGDLFDFRPMRRGASEDEKAEGFTADFNAGMKFLKLFKPDVYLRGNHCERPWDIAAGRPGVVRDLMQEFVGKIEREVKAMRCRMLPYHKREGVYQLGHLKMLHGYACGINAARKHAWTYSNCLFGHTHSIDHVTLERPERTMARNVGCLCELDMDYNRAHIASLRHSHGWAYGVVHDRTGLFHVFQAERVGEKFLLPTGLEEL